MLLVTLTLLFALASVFYVYLVWHFGHWKRKGFKEAKTYPLVGSFPSFFTQKRHVTYDSDEIYNAYKDTENFVGVYSCRLPQLMILNPKMVLQVFVNNFRNFHDNEMSIMVDSSNDVLFGLNPFVLKGDAWKERRAELTMGLTSHRIGAAYPVTQYVCTLFSDYIRKQIKMVPKDGLNAKDITIRFTSEVVSDCVLGLRANSFTDKPSEIYYMAQNFFSSSASFVTFMFLSTIFPALRKVINVPFITPDKVQFFTGLMRQSIEMRLANRQDDRLDFLNYMLELRQKKNMSVENLTAHSMSFLTDGFETTSIALSHTLLMLGRNPHVQQKLRKEIGTENLSYEQLHKIPYLEACIHEALRIIPIVSSLRKLCTEPFELTNKDGRTVSVNPGDVIIIPVSAIHLDEKYYDNPLEYRPERFIDDTDGSFTKKYQNMGVNLAFGNGPRICPGIRFSMTQMAAAIVEIIRNFEIKVNPRTRTDNYLNETYFLGTIKDGIWLDFEELQK